MELGTLSQLFQSDQLDVSIEIFPPKSSQGDHALFETLDCLTRFDPQFISCTYGAGGSTQSRTVDLCTGIQNRYQIPTTSHITCVGATREQLADWLTKTFQAGVKNFMALRGDAPQGEESFQTVSGGLSYANELVSLIRELLPDAGIGVAAYPEKHPEAVDLSTDLGYLKQKIDAGADAAFTQLFYENENFFHFRELYDRQGCQIPLIPGIMPITDFKRIKRITAMCGAVFPETLSSQLEAVQDSAEDQFEIGVNYAIEQCRELIDAGIPGIHFYALNKSQACERILSDLGLNQQVSPTL